MGARDRCCCGGTCYLLVDHFDNAASTTLSSDWTEVVEDWEYSGSGEVITGDDGACMLTTAQSTTGEQHVMGITYSIAAGEKYRLLANAVDQFNYLFAELESKVDGYTLRLGTRTSGSDIILFEQDFTDILVPENGVGITICLSRYVFCGMVTNEPVTSAAGNQIYTYNHSLHGNGKRAGLWNGHSTAMAWTEFAFGDLVGDGAGAVVGECRTNQCCEMPCVCCENEDDYELPLPQNLLLTITATGGCEPLDGATVAITYNPASGDWESAVNDPSCFVQDSMWVFTCNLDNVCLPATGSGSFGLYMRDPIGGCYHNQCFHSEDGWFEAYFTCDPAVIVFPLVIFEARWAAIEECDCCDYTEDSTFQAVVTEAPPIP